MMNCKDFFINASAGIKLSCLVALMGHLAITVYDKLNPKGAIAISEKIKLDQIDFPAVFKNLHITKLQQNRAEESWIQQSI